MGCGSSLSRRVMYDPSANKPTPYPDTPRGTSGFGIRTSGVREDWSGFEEHALHEHNALRERHGSPPLGMRRDLCDLAQIWANDLSTMGALMHSPLELRRVGGIQCGENLYINTNTSPHNVSASAATDSWYCESFTYDFSVHDIQDGTANFTQLVWYETRSLGIAASFVRQGAWHTVIVVALYWPAGNVISRMATNVLPPVSRKRQLISKEDSGYTEDDSDRNKNSQR